MAAIAFDAGGGLGAAWLASTAGGGWVFRMDPMMKKRVPIPTAEMNNESLRPRNSTPKKMKMLVATNLTTP